VDQATEDVDSANTLRLGSEAKEDRVGSSPDGSQILVVG
jgi:hypothetical protein